MQQVSTLKGGNGLVAHARRGVGCPRNPGEGTVEDKCRSCGKCDKRFTPMCDLLVGISAELIDKLADDAKREGVPLEDLLFSVPDGQTQNTKIGGN